MRFFVTALTFAQLGKEPLALVGRIIQLGISIRDFHSADIQLETLDQTRIARFLFRERRKLDRIVINESRLHEMLFCHSLEQTSDEISQRRLWIELGMQTLQQGFDGCPIVKGALIDFFRREFQDGFFH